MMLCCILLSVSLETSVAFGGVKHNSGTARSLPHRRVLSHTQKPGALGMVQSASPFSAFTDLFNPSKQSSATLNSNAAAGQQVVESFIASINSRADPATIAEFFTDDVNFVDTSYYNPIVGKDALRKHFYLHAGSSALSTFARTSEFSSAGIVIDDILAVSDNDKSKVCVMYHLTDDNGEDLADTTAISFFNVVDGKISSAFDVTEPSSPKPGDSGLKLLKTVSNLIGDESIVMTTNNINDNDQSLSAVEKYFDAWNKRDMKLAVSQFTENCSVRDLQYDDAFSNRDELETHLLRCKDCLPSSFNFVIDDIAMTKDKAGVLWHVENSGEPLSFTRGCSFYTLDRNGLIQTGFDIPEKAPPKTGFLKTLSSKFEAEPFLFIPAAMWVAYMYILFISDGILPGANALALEQRTWEEVRDLSINFFLVSPLLNLPFSPVVHPMLEGVFNLLLSWAAMFACFLSDERKDKPNLLPFGPMLVGMQFLTSGFLLPYLFTRTPEFASQVYKEDIDGEIQAKVAEWRPLGGFLSAVGTASIVWAFIGRPEFGEFAERYSSFIDLLSIDRVGSSFIVDLVIFAIFQPWFVDDDLRRRGVTDGELMGLRNIAKYVPFFGLAAYITLRPELPSRASSE